MSINEKAGRERVNDSEGRESAFSGGEPTENDSSLQALVDQEQSYARERLREKTGREPAQEEIDRWLSEQTEGY